MDRNSGQIVQRLTEEYASWFLRDERLAQGRLSGRLYPFERLFCGMRVGDATRAGLSRGSGDSGGPAGSAAVPVDRGRSANCRQPRPAR